MDAERCAQRTNLRTNRRAPANEMEPPSCAERYDGVLPGIHLMSDAA